MDPQSNPVQPEPDKWIRVLSYALVHGVYGKLLVWPTFLCYDYSLDAIPLVRTATDVRLLLPASVYLAVSQLICVSLWPLRTRWWAVVGGAKAKMGVRESPIVGLAILFLSFLPMSNVFFPVGTMIGERLLYIPSAGLLLTVVSLAHLHGVSQRRRPRLGAASLLFVGAGGAWLCAVRVPEWKDEHTITVVDGLKQLRSSRVQFNFGNARLKAKRYDEALFTYQRAIAVDPEDRDSLPLYHSGQILFYHGRHVEAEAYLEKAVSGYYSPLMIKEEEVFHDYALVLWFTQKAYESILNFQKSLALNPSFTKALNNLACAAGYGSLSGALTPEYMQYGLQHLEHALALEPRNILYWRNAVSLLSLGGNTQAAQGAWQQVQMLDPEGSLAGPPGECAWEFYFR